MKSIRIGKIAMVISQVFAVLLAVPFVLVLLANQIIITSSETYLYELSQQIPYNSTGLILGTSHRLRDGRPNPYFHSRINTAADLYHRGKVSYLIASGDNRTQWYNEPEQMRRELLALGVPDSVIYLDYAGLRTLDSVIRCRKVFGQEQFTIISQRFHNQRAVYIARQHGLNVVAVNAPDPEGATSPQLQVREWFAKVNVFWDQLTKKQPRFTGERIQIGGQREL